MKQRDFNFKINVSFVKHSSIFVRQNSIIHFFFLATLKQRHINHSQVIRNSLLFYQFLTKSNKTVNSCYWHLTGCCLRNWSFNMELFDVSIYHSVFSSVFLSFLHQDTHRWWHFLGLRFRCWTVIPMSSALSCPTWFCSGLSWDLCRTLCLLCFQWCMAPAHPCYLVMQRSYVFGQWTPCCVKVSYACSIVCCL